MNTKRADTEVEVVEPATNGRVYLSRDDILAAADVVYEDVAVPEWGGTVRVRSLTGTERDAYDAESYAQSQVDGKTDTGAALFNFRVRRVARGIVDGDGARVFTDTDIAALGRKNASVLDRVDDVVARLSGMVDESGRAAIEALKAAPSGGSGTA